MSGPVYWRPGSKVGRTLYRGDELVGLVDTPALAMEIVTAVNARGRSLVEVAADSIEAFAGRLGGDRDELHVAQGMRQAVAIMRRIAERESGRERSPATEPLPRLLHDPYDSTKGWTEASARAVAEARAATAGCGPECRHVGANDHGDSPPDGQCYCGGCIGMGPCDDDLGKRDEPECDHPWHDGEDVSEHPACPRCGELYAWSCCGSTDPEHLPSRCTEGGVAGG